MTPLVGFCYVGWPPDGDVVRMDELKPGDTFLFLRCDDPVFPLLAEWDPDEREATEQEVNLWKALIARSKRYRYAEVDAPSFPDGRAGCTAVEVDEDGNDLDEELPLVDLP